MKKLLLTLCTVSALLLLGACGGGETEETPTAPSGDLETLEATYWTLQYDPEQWLYDEVDFYDDEDGSSVILIIPGDEEDTYLVNAEIRVDIDDPYSFRDYLTSYGFDQYEYAVNNAYEFTPVGGVDCLMEEGNYWGEPCLRYFNRVEAAGATVFMEIIGEYEDERVAALLSGLTFNLPDIGNEDGPWAWEGEPFSAEDHSVMVGTYTLQSKWLPITDCIVSGETFDHQIAVSGDKAYILSGGTLGEYLLDGAGLTYQGDVALSNEFEALQADDNGTLWLSSFMEPLVSWKDGAQTAAYEGPDYVAMHPSGAWGISWFSGPECEKVTPSGGALSTAPITFAEVETIAHLNVSDNYIFVCGYAADDSGHKVFVYNTDGVLQTTLADADGEGLGSITFMAETPNGFLGLDGNMREVCLWSKDGSFIGAADDGDLFGTGYPWFCGGFQMPDGSILVAMTDDRADESAMELVVFQLSGF